VSGADRIAVSTSHDDQGLALTLQLGHSAKTRFYSIQFTSALLICYVPHRPLIWYCESV